MQYLKNSYRNILLQARELNSCHKLFAKTATWPERQHPVDTSHRHQDQFCRSITQNHMFIASYNKTLLIFAEVQPVY